jgi:hypothetical protein
MDDITKTVILPSQPAHKVPLEVIESEWLERATLRVINELEFEGGTFTTDDLHAAIEAPVQRNWWGVLMAQLKRAGDIERVGYQMSKRKEANGRAVAVWRIKQ